VGDRVSPASDAGSVRVLRGEHVESVHRFAWRLWDGKGSAQGAGDIGDVFVRSAAKPFLTLPSVRAGVLERFGLATTHLAVSCGSHGGGRVHLARVGEILGACGLDEASLGCGSMPPRDRREHMALGGPPGRMHHNCSGKHALALALCRAEGWAVEDYLEADHPLQDALRASVAEAADLPDSQITEAVDGCGMRTYAFALERLAASFGRLAGGALGPAGARAASAMGAHPSLVAFRGAVDTEIMAAAPGVVAKIGAEAVLAVGTPDGRGMALKILDGSTRALDPAGVLAARELLGLELDSPPLRALAHPEIRNSRGELVGRIEASLNGTG
jgi:L-asparaginase II